MPTPTDDQSQHARLLETGAIAVADPEHLRISRESAGDTEVIDELQEHDFILDPDETIELPTGPRSLPTPAPKLPPLPPWAAASRALLSDAPAPLDESQQARELREAREDLVRFARQMYAREVYVQEVQRALAVARGRLRGQAFRLAELRQQPALRSSQRRSTAPAAALAAKRKSAIVRDDLQRIRGIGPRLAERLHQLGVASFESVAGWKAQDVERVARKLGVTPERIERAGWVKQARALQARSRKRA